MVYLEQIKEIQARILQKKEALTEELRYLPDGELFISRRKDGAYYYQRFPKKGNRKKEVRKGITRDKEMIRDLVRKRYVLEALPAIDVDIQVLKDFIMNYKPFDENCAMREFIFKNPELADYIYRDAGDIDEWAANYERPKDFYEESKTSIAGNRMAMRSRGEVVIGEKLRQYGIPYRYEASLGIPDLPYVPDFTIKRLRDGKIFYWEHFGDVNDEKYMKRNQRKIERYDEYGIVPWDNLIITYDFQDGGINVPLIEGMIHAWLL